MEKLKPCPFCGSEAEHDGYTSIIGKRSIDSHIITCLNEEKCGISIGSFETKEEAIKAWNTRPYKISAKYQRDKHLETITKI